MAVCMLFFFSGNSSPDLGVGPNHYDQWSTDGCTCYKYPMSTGPEAQGRVFFLTWGQKENASVRISFSKVVLEKILCLDACWIPWGLSTDGQPLIERLAISVLQICSH